MTDVVVSEMKNAKLLCIDIETKDPKLMAQGPGTVRNDGYICGVAFGAMIDSKEHAAYLDIKHPDTDPVEKERNEKIITELLLSSSEKLGANIIYDIEWLEHEGFNIDRKTLHDVQYAEPLLDEYRRSYSLSALSEVYNVGTKKTNDLENYCNMMAWSAKNAREHIWKMPATVVEAYAVEDATLPIKIFKKQKVKLEAEGLWELYKIETALMSSLLRMRKNGVRIDKSKLRKAVLAMTDQRFSLEKKLKKVLGDININSSAQLARVFDRLGISYPRNPPTELMKAAGKQGNPNLDKTVLSKLAKEHAICKDILDYRHVDTLINMFLHPYLELIVNGRLHGQFHPLRSDDYGTVAGRFSASKPNLQQVSAIDEDNEDESLKGKLLRALFIPEEGHKWVKLDYSQIEYRIMAHYAEGSAANSLRQQYILDERTDMHQVICDKTGFDRRTAKRLNFGGAYGMGVKTASELFGWSYAEADAFMGAYHNAAPYVKKLRNQVSDVAARRGYIRTILGRKARTHPSRKLHSMFNRLIQGSAADVIKKAIVDAESKGLFDELLLHLTVHDELDVSEPNTKAGKEATEELKITMENAVKFDVPVLVECHKGKNWAEAD